MGHEDLVTSADPASAISMGDKIYCLRRASAEYYFCAFDGIQKRRNATSRPLVGEGCLLTEKVDAPMDVGIVFLVVALNGVDNGSRLLRCCSIVEVDQGPISHGSSEDRKVTAHGIHVEGGQWRLCNILR